MKLILLTYYYPPDLSAGSFRSKALAERLSKDLKPDEELIVITTEPNRYDTYRKQIGSLPEDDNFDVYRIHVPQHANRIISQAWSFTVFFFKSFFILRKIKPDFIFCTTGRHMTSSITYIFSLIFNVNYYVDFRDIFSEAISEIYGRNNKFVRSFVRKFFLSIEKIVLKKAKAVNTVSEAFFEYYSNAGLDISNWTFFPNGIDEEFMNIPISNQVKRSNKVILYAGNIGTGQGLEIILPMVSRELSDKYRFVIIGDGVMRSKLKKIISHESINNVIIKKPMSRNDLYKEYLHSDILFLHLNKLEAFQRSLPSKIFEYAVIGKPIIGGLSGYSSQFLKDHIPHSYVFKPGDSIGCIKAIKEAENISIKQEDIDLFKSKFSRSSIMKSLSEDVLECARKNYSN